MSFSQLLQYILHLSWCWGVAAATEQTKEPRSYPVGMTTRAFVDGFRKNWQGTDLRPLNTVIWYPAKEGSQTAPFAATPETTKFFGDSESGKYFVKIPVAVDAPPFVSRQKHPLILLSHGSTGLGLSLMWLGHYLASHGYIVAAVNHHGNTAAEGQLLPQAFGLVWERPADLTAILTKVLADPTFGRQIDPNRIGAAGFSAGGATVIQIAGGTFDSAALTAFCGSPQNQGDSTCEPRELIRQSIVQMQVLRRIDPVVRESVRHEKEPRRDLRVKGVFAMAPALGPAFTEQDLIAIDIPCKSLLEMLITLRLWRPTQSTMRSSLRAQT